MMKNRQYFHLFALLIALCLAYNPLQGQQRFKAAAVAGFNMAQIDGDLLYGYNKLGLHGGLKLDYPLRNKIDVSLEMLYNNKGSTSGFGFGSQSNAFTSLSYLDLPIMITIKDWYVKDADYYKVSAHGGISPGFLFSVASSNGSIFEDLDTYSDIDISYFFGINYRFNRRLGLTVRHTRAFTNLLAKDEDMPDGNQAIGYFVTIRTEFYF